MYIFGHFEFDRHLAPAPCTNGPVTRFNPSLQLNACRTKLKHTKSESIKLPYTSLKKQTVGSCLKRQTLLSQTSLLRPTMQRFMLRVSNIVFNTRILSVSKNCFWQTCRDIRSKCGRIWLLSYINFIFQILAVFSQIISFTVFCINNL